MFSALKIHHFTWYIVLDIFLHLLLFACITSLVVFLLRGPLRQYKPYDLRVFNKLRAIHTPRNNRIMKGLTFLGKHQFLIPANLSLIAVLFFWSDRHWYAFNILVLSLSSLLLMFMLKHLFHRNRPQEPLLFEARGKSFPSGHAIMSVCFYGLILHMVLHSSSSPEVLKVTCLVLGIMLIALIGFSRIYLQVHYLSDVLAGFIIGGCWLYVALHVFSRLEHV